MRKIANRRRLKNIGETGDVSRFSQGINKVFLSRIRSIAIPEYLKPIISIEALAVKAALKIVLSSPLRVDIIAPASGLYEAEYFILPDSKITIPCTLIAELLYSARHTKIIFVNKFLGFLFLLTFCNIEF